MRRADRLGQRVDIALVVIDPEGGARRRREIELVHQRLGAVVAGAHGDIVLIQEAGDVVRMNAVDGKGQDAETDLRDQARQRAASATDSGLKDQLNGLVQKLEDFRSTLVSVKEGGMW